MLVLDESQPAIGRELPDPGGFETENPGRLGLGRSRRWLTVARPKRRLEDQSPGVRGGL